MAGAADVVIDVLSDDVQGLPELWRCLCLVGGHEGRSSRLWSLV